MYYEKVCSLHFEDHYGPVAISHILPLGVRTISRWLYTFAEENGKLPPKMAKELTKMSAPADLYAEIERLRSELHSARRALADAELRATAFNELIDVAEETLHISIRKKAGTKQ